MSDKRIGDGTGQGSQPPESEGLSHVGGDEAGKDTGGGAATHDGPHRTSHPHGSPKK